MKIYKDFSAKCNLLSPLVDCKCDIPTVTTELKKSLDDATVVYTNARFFLRAKLRDNCNTPSYYKLYWEVCRCDESTGMCDPVIKYGGVWKPTRPKLLFPRLFRGTGYLYIRCLFKTSSKDQLDVKSYGYGYLRLVLPPLVPRIIGPSSVVRGNYTFVTLDASESYDPDRKTMKTKGMSINWFCKEESEIHEEPATDLPSSEEPATDLPSAMKERPGSCYNLTGEVNDSSLELLLNLQNIKGNRSYVFQLVIQKGDRTAQTTHKLRVNEPFVLSIG